MYRICLKNGDVFHSYDYHVSSNRIAEFGDVTVPVENIQQIERFFHRTLLMNILIYGFIVLLVFTLLVQFDVIGQIIGFFQSLFPQPVLPA